MMIALTNFRQSRVAAAAAILAASLTGFAPAPAAADYPSRPVRIVVPFPPGGPLDFTARAVAEHLSIALKQPFIVDNRPGATGNIGTEIVARSAADGYTLLFVLDTVLTANPALYSQLPFQPQRDLAPISIAASFHQMLVVHPSLDVGSLAQFIQFAKRGTVTYGSGGGSGNPGHLVMEHFRQRAGFEARNVSYRGAPQVTSDLLAGHIQVGFLTTPAVLPHVRSGKLRALAVSSLQRARSAPDVPTVAESGYPGFEAAFHLVLLAPAALPPHIHALLEREVRAALKSPALLEQMRAQELAPVGSTGDEARVRLDEATERWRQVIRQANISAD